MARPRRSEGEEAGRSSLWGGPYVALAAILVLATALRFVAIDHGPLLHAERQLVPRAWRMVHGGGADPDPFFRWPSLILYLLAPYQTWESHPSYLAARLEIAVLGLVAVCAAWWLGRRAYGTVAGAVAAAVTAVETTHVGASHVTTPDVPLTIGVAAALAFAAGGRLEAAGIAAGLATAVKWPGVLLLVPLVAAAWGRWWRLAGAVGLGLVAFAVASPFAVVHLGTTLGDLHRALDSARGGDQDGVAVVLWHGLGPALVVALAGLVLALGGRSRPDLVLASFVLAFAVSLVALGAGAVRFVLPLVPALGALAGRLRALAPVTLLLLVVPLAWSIRDDRDHLRARTLQPAIGSTISRSEDPRGHRAAHARRDGLRMLGRAARVRRAAGREDVPGRLAAAREPDPGARLLPGLAP